MRPRAGRARVDDDARARGGGEAIVRKVPALRAFAPAVRSHHERLDGRGYIPTSCPHRRSR